LATRSRHSAFSKQRRKREDDMIQFVLGEAMVQVQQGENGVKVMIATDPASGIQVVMPLPEEAARSIAAALGSGLIVASNLPPLGKRL